MTFDWRDNELKMSRYITQKMADLAHATGATIVGPAWARKGPYDVRAYQTTHITGGTVMGADPATSVVSPHLQHWDAENLFVVGASWGLLNESKLTGRATYGHEIVAEPKRSAPRAGRL